MNAIVKRATNSIKRLWSLVVYAFQSPVQDSHSKRRTAILFSLVLVVHLVVLPAHELGSDIGLRSFGGASHFLSLYFVKHAYETMAGLIVLILLNIFLTNDVQTRITGIVLILGLATGYEFILL